jgi:uncharacterized iron-regulated protein
MRHRLPASPATLLRFLSSCVLLALAGCASGEALLLGEQHDAPDHRKVQREWVERLAARDRLAALALEMADQGVSTAALPPTADEAQVREALRWSEQSWPWEVYAPVVMSAVRAGVPVLGANLPRDMLREAMEDPQLDVLLPEPALRAQQRAVREGHCGLLPERQIGPMTRIQIARDRSMAQTLAGASRPGKTVVLVAGAGHVDPEVGVPRHLPPGMRVRQVVLPPHETGKDYCAELKQKMG